MNKKICRFIKMKSCVVFFFVDHAMTLHIYTDMFNLCEGILSHTFTFCLQNSCHSLHLPDIYSPDHIAMYLMIYILTVDTTLSWLFVSKSGVYFIHSNNVHTFKITSKQIDPYLVCISYFKWSSKNLHKPTHTLYISCIQNLPHKQTCIMCIAHSKSLHRQAHILCISHIQSLIYKLTHSFCISCIKCSPIQNLFCHIFCIFHIFKCPYIKNVFYTNWFIPCPSCSFKITLAYVIHSNAHTFKITFKKTDPYLV